jgi:cytochrome c2
MNWAFVKLSIFTALIILFFVYIGDNFSKLLGESNVRTTVEEVSPEAGRNIFWGKGKCSTCHSVGSEGSAIRGPNLAGIGARAGEEMKEHTATQHLVQALVEPGAYVVAGYKNEMPVIVRPPIALNEKEVRSLVAYLQSLGGKVDVEAIKIPATAYAQVKVKEMGIKPIIKGDPARGEQLFFGKGNCFVCHKIEGKGGGSIGPELTGLAGRQPPGFIWESMVKPDAVVASGYQSGIMPSDYPEKLSFKEMLDIWAFLQKLE